MIKGKGGGGEVEKCPKFPLSTFMGWSLNIVSRSTITQLLRAGRSATSSPTPKVTLHGWIVIERRRRARLRCRLLLTPWQRGLVKRMFHGKISPSLIIPDCILPRSQRPRERETRGTEWKHRGLKRRRGMSRGRMKGAMGAILLSRGVENVFRIPPWKRSFRGFLKTQSFYVLRFPN